MTTQTIKTSGKVFEALQKQLKKDNAKFKKLTRPQQRVAIAEDVILQIRAKKFVANSTYFEWGAPGVMVDDYSIDAAKVEELDASECVSQVKCSVCGIGSLFMSGIRKADKLKVDELDLWNTRDQAVRYLQRWFGSGQLDLIEDYYERMGEKVEDEGGDNFRNFSSPIYRQDNNNKRLVMIMENIISNTGKFDPKKGKHKIDRDPVTYDDDPYTAYED